MSEPWMLFEKHADESPQLYQVAKRLQLDPEICFSRWFHLWSWIDDRFPDGKMAGVSFSELDQVARTPGLAAAFSEVGWIRPAEDGLEVPEFSKRWGRDAVRRYLARTKKRQQRQRGRSESIDAASNASIGDKPEGRDRDRSGTERGQKRDSCPESVPQSVAPRADLDSGSSSFGRSYSYSIDRIESIRLESIDRGDCDWEKMLEEAKRIRRWVRSQTPAKALADKGLILRACILAQTRLNEAWLWQALEAVKDHGPLRSSAAYFRSCLVNGLTAFTAGQAQIVGGQDRGELAALYRRLEGLVPISDEQIRQLLASMSSQQRGREQASSG